MHLTGVSPGPTKVLQFTHFLDSETEVSGAAGLAPALTGVVCEPREWGDHTEECTLRVPPAASCPATGPPIVGVSPRGQPPAAGGVCACT